jgi:ABC-2 type transport system ATP-binding protein
MSSVLSLRAVTKRYRRRGPWVLSGADLSLEKGSLTSIVGANGSGKSTVLRIAAGVTSPSDGRAVVPRRVGYVPERQAGRCKFSGAEYVTHMGRIRGLDTDGATKAGTELLMRLGLRPGPDVSWNELSKGNRQKVVVAQAFLGRLDAVVLDEPYSGLDETARAVLTQLITEVRTQGTPVLLSSHDFPAGMSQSYCIVGGHLEERAPTPPPATKAQPMRRVDLGHQGGGHALDELTRRSDVVRWEATPEGTGLVLEVIASGSDSLIRAALDLGCTVRSVVPIAASGGD